MTLGQGQDLDLQYSHTFIYSIRCLLLLTFKALAAKISEKSTVFTYSCEKFSISFTNGCVEVKMCTVISSLTQKHFGHHLNSSIIALINFQCVFVHDIAAVKHGAPHGTHGISANAGAFDILLKPVIGKLIVLNNQSALIGRKLIVCTDR